jgi:hypothetical protein
MLRSCSISLFPRATVCLLANVVNDANGSFRDSLSRHLEQRLRGNNAGVAGLREDNSIEYNRNPFAQKIQGFKKAAGHSDSHGASSSSDASSSSSSASGHHNQPPRSEAHKFHEEQKERATQRQQRAQDSADESGPNRGPRFRSQGGVASPEWQVRRRRGSSVGDDDAAAAAADWSRVIPRNEKPSGFSKK